jgi:hypothetical protein
MSFHDLLHKMIFREMKWAADADTPVALLKNSGRDAGQQV